MSSAPRILLADADAFYVAVARLADPEGAGKARFLIVGGSPEQRGVVTSASYEARAYGVHSAMPMARAVRLCPGATVVPVPWDACVRKSGEIGAVLRRSRRSCVRMHPTAPGRRSLRDRGAPPGPWASRNGHRRHAPRTKRTSRRRVAPASRRR